MEIDCSLVWWSMGLCETHQYVCIVHSPHEEFYYQATWPFIVAVAFLQLSNLVLNICIMGLHCFWTSNRNLSFFSIIISLNMFRRGRDIDRHDKIYEPLVLTNSNSYSPIEEKFPFPFLISLFHLVRVFGNSLLLVIVVPHLLIPCCVIIH